MSEHYYSRRPGTESRKETIELDISGKSMPFWVDRGVFSRGGLDFGSRLLLESWEAPSVDGPVLDAGCGWGPLGLTIASWCPEREVVLVDINERSAELSRANAERQRLGNVTVRQQNLMEGEEPGTYAAVVTNPPIRAGKDVVFQLYEGAWEVLRPGGVLYVVIQKKQGAPSTKQKLQDLGFHVETKAKSKGYFIFAAEKTLT
ncbi:class I SAM-dependent methyltransferase [Alkalicoccus urumqiensis]|uniref:16S rRNA methyltransferase n=1 Tax=Alkalicoccus urumqiensis TaxID=1548213 RepID=A0A2P6MEA9_ALKUR|nr:methyltransferase [Alkalicoccus urumqiensis]PRO64618.1 16S rRNA methyltransferase [Alkalicoccus urumqiensis]